MRLQSCFCMQYCLLAIMTKEVKLRGVEGDGMNWETGTDTYTLLTLCTKYITNENLLYSSGNSGALWGLKCEGNTKKGGYMYIMYS